MKSEKTHDIFEDNFLGMFREFLYICQISVKEVSGCA